MSRRIPSTDMDSSCPVLSRLGRTPEVRCHLIIMRIDGGGGGEKDCVLELAKLRLIRYRCRGSRAAVCEWKGGGLEAF